MAYIGQSIKNGTFSVLDTSGNTYNGSNVTFSLGTQVGSPAQLLVSHDGVVQKPGTDYTLATGGTQITFTTAPASGASIFIVEISGAVGGPINSDLNGNELVLDVDGDTSITADTDDQIDFKVGGSDIFQMTASKLDVNGKELILDADADTSITADTDDQIDFKTGGTDRARIDSSGNVFIGTTSTNTGVDSSSTGFYFRDGGQLRVARDNSQPIVANRLSGDGVILDFRKDGTTIGSVNVGDHDLIIGKTDGGVQCYLRYGL